MPPSLVVANLGRTNQQSKMYSIQFSIDQSLSSIHRARLQMPHPRNGDGGSSSLSRFINRWWLCHNSQIPSSIFSISKSTVTSFVGDGKARFAIAIDSVGNVSHVLLLSRREHYFMVTNIAWQRRKLGKIL